MRGKLRNMLKERGVHYEPKEEDEDFDEEEGYETVEWRVCWEEWYRRCKHLLAITTQ